MASNRIRAIIISEQTRPWSGGHTAQFDKNVMAFFCIDCHRYLYRSGTGDCPQQ